MANSAIYPSLKDRVVLVTGGAMGIGEATVRAFAAQGAKVGFLDVADAAASKLQTEIGAAAKLHYEHCDVTDIAALRTAIEKVRATLGPVTILVNNAAHDERHKVAEVTPAFFDDRIAVNRERGLLFWLCLRLRRCGRLCPDWIGRRDEEKKK